MNVFYKKIKNSVCMYLFSLFRLNALVVILARTIHQDDYNFLLFIYYLFFLIFGQVNPWIGIVKLVKLHCWRDNLLQDELLWGAAWLYRASKESNYWNYVVENIHNLENTVVKNINGFSYRGGSYAEFGWDTKHAGISILVSNVRTYLHAL